MLLPVLEQLTLLSPDSHPVESSGSEFISPDSATPADGDWVILPSNRASGGHCHTRQSVVIAVINNKAKCNICVRFKILLWCKIFKICYILIMLWCVVFFWGGHC